MERCEIEILHDADDRAPRPAYIEPPAHGIAEADHLGGRPDARVETEACIDERGRLLIRVRGNGPGVVDEALEKIFVPFYSTKKGGTGIGLSLSRQIMRLNRGDLTARSISGEETVFTMRF